MALFTLTDIKIADDIRSVSSNQLIDSKYELNTLRYPIDLGSADKGHYMVFHINEQKRTSFPGITTGDDTSAAVISQNRTSMYGGPTDLMGNIAKTGDLALASLKTMYTYLPSFIQKQISKEDELGDMVMNDDVAKTFLQDMAKNGFRTTKRTTDTVALYMPDTLAFTQAQSYSTPSTTGMFAGGLAAGLSAFEGIKSGGEFTFESLKTTAQNLSPFIGAYLARNNQTAQAIYTGLTGTTINPMLEVIYSSPQLRNFRFDFMFYPRSSKEAKEVQNIIQRFRFHSSPEILNDGSSGGFFLVPPSEFDIKFYYNGTENPNIPTISTCVLTAVDVDYAPSGFAAYEEVNSAGTPEWGGTGMPVAIRMSLAFQETQIQTKLELANRAATVSGSLSQL